MRAQRPRIVASLQMEKKGQGELVLELANGGATLKKKIGFAVTLGKVGFQVKKKY